MQNFGVTNKEYYGMLWYFLEWSMYTTDKVVGTTDGARGRQSKHLQPTE